MMSDDPVIRVEGWGDERISYVCTFVFSTKKLYNANNVLWKCRVDKQNRHQKLNQIYHPLLTISGDYR